MNHTGKPRVLIVDDAPQNLHMLMELLKDDYELSPAKDGKTALAKALGDPAPDLILLDIIMPGMDGYEVCRRLKENESARSIPVIFLTAVSEAMDAAKAFAVGGVDYVTKPFNPVTVKARVKTHIRLSRAINDLSQALKQIKTLSGLLPICANCKKIRDDKGYWKEVEVYIASRTDASFSHGICPECAKKLYPEHFKK